MQKNIKKADDYSPKQTLCYLTEIQPKIESMLKFSTMAYMFSIKDKDNPFSSYAFNIATKRASLDNLQLKKTSNYITYRQGEKFTTISCTLSPKS